MGAVTRNIPGGLNAGLEWVPYKTAMGEEEVTDKDGRGPGARSIATAEIQSLTDRGEMEGCSGQKSSWGSGACMVPDAPSLGVGTVVAGVNLEWGRKRKISKR